MSLLWVVGLVGWCLTAPAHAVVLPDFHRVTVTVADRSTEARQAALREATALMLIRMTGMAAVGDLAGAGDFLQVPERYVQEYRYRVRTVESDAGEPAVPPAEVEGTEGVEQEGRGAGPGSVMELEVQFDVGALAQALRVAGLPLWGRERPALLVWLAAETSAGGRYLVAADDPGSLRETAEQVARRRGLALLFPLMDLEDRARVEVADVWGGFVEQLEPVSRRYPVQGLVLGRVQRLAEAAWTGSFVLEFDGEQIEWQVDGTDAEEVVERGLFRLADELGQRLAVRPGGMDEGEAHIRVEGVADLKAYARVMDYLEALTQVRRVRLEAVGNGMLDLLLEVDGGLRALEQAVAVSGVLQPAGETGVYRLLP